MSLFDFFKKQIIVFFRKQTNEQKNEETCQKFISLYKMETVQEILSIPIKAGGNYSRNLNAVTVPEAILDRMATKYKRAGEMELAVACLRKANEFRRVSIFSYSRKSYERLVSYLKINREFEEADKVQAEIDTELNHSATNKGVETASRPSLETDLINVTHSATCCAECAKYRDRVYSKSGLHKKYPKYPDFLKENPNHCGLHGFLFYEGISEMSVGLSNRSVDAVAYSNRPFVDDRKSDEKARYEKLNSERQQEKQDHSDYDFLWKNMPDIAPKSFSGYRRMRNSNSKNFQKIVALAKEQGYEISI